MLLSCVKDSKKAQEATKNTEPPVEMMSKLLSKPPSKVPLDVAWRVFSQETNKLADFTSTQLFANKKTVLVSLPGAFTPT